ncbi:lipopolysaccharide biosynthesis protein [Adhaeretor mobilis]|uniref:MurJ-like flippase n=1 Tax=Adhaeretor mobilis TaxID=1930276 RepID=A0A517MVT9_9BACT|nr:oligosaccharide flippase family protein [Adhaeretor mobilis]QDS98996.1 MurJ-like flippase [Adhaeretor mobilis]
MSLTVKSQPTVYPTSGSAAPPALDTTASEDLTTSKAEKSPEQVSSENSRLWRRLAIGASALPVLAIFDQGIVSGGNFLTTVILGNFCTEADLGVYGKGMTIVVMLVSLPMALIWTPYNVYSSDMSARRHSAYKANSLLHLLVIIAVAAVSLSMAALFSASQIVGLLFALSAAAGFLLIREHARRLSFARMDMASAIKLDVLVTGLHLTLLGTAAWLGWLSGARAFLILGLACLLGIALMTHQWVPKTFPRRRGVKLDFFRNWKMSKYVFAGTILFTCSNGAYPWLLGYFYGDAAVGRLTAAGGAIFLANPLLIAATNYFGPAMVRNNRESGAAGVYRTAVACVLGIAALMLLFCGVMYFFGGWFVETVFSNSYAGLDALVMSLAFAQLVNAMLIPLRSGLFALDQGRLMIHGGVVRMICLATIGIYAVRVWGPVGVGIGMLSGDLAAVMIKTYYLRKLALQSGHAQSSELSPERVNAGGSDR